MSCRLIQRSYIADLELISKFLTDGCQRGRTQDDEDENDYKKELPDDNAGKVHALSNFLISISPTEEFLVLASDKRVVFMTNKIALKAGNVSEQCMKPCWQGTLSSQETEHITCLLCIPLASQHRSSQGCPDWSCVVVGFSSGFIRIYMQNGDLLISQVFHNGPVLALHMRTKMQLKDGSITDQVEELLILYTMVVVVIDGFSLFQSLKACRNQLAKARACQFQEVIEYPALAYRKWILKDQEEIIHAVNCGIIGSCLFDKIVESSLSDVSLPNTRPASNPRRIISSGRGPVVGWYELVEESTTLFMSDVAFSVASKFTSAVISSITNATGEWLRLSSKAQSSQQKNSRLHGQGIEKGTVARLRYGIPDKRRRACSMSVSPNDSLIACTDDFGRVLLVSSETGVLVRMWKGYRDAQCGWLVGEEKSNDSSGDIPVRLCRALFLVIYAPRRGILEIWLTDQGARVGAFNVGKDCRLIYNAYGVLGNVGVFEKHTLDDLQYCFLVDRSGTISSISVPFHCCLSLVQSVEARDAYLLQKLSSVFSKCKETSFSAVDRQVIENLVAVFEEVKALHVQLKGILLVLSCEHLTKDAMEKMLLAIICILRSRADMLEEDDDLEYNEKTQKLVLFCSVQLDLLELFQQLVDLQSMLEDCSYPEDVFPGDDEFKALLYLSDSEILSFQDCMSQLKTPSSEVANGSINTVSVASFLELFLFNTASESGILHFVHNTQLPDGKQPDLSYIGKNMCLLFFKSIVEKKMKVADIKFLLNSPHVPPLLLMQIITAYTQTEDAFLNFDYASLMYLHTLISSICFLKKDKFLEFKDDIRSWWIPIRSSLEGSTRARQCLLMSFICRSISASQKEEETAIPKQVNTLSELQNDIDDWNVCIQRASDLIALHDFLMIDSCNEDQHATVRHDLCIKGILESNHGSISQIVASHIVRQGVPAPCIIDINIAPCKQNETASSENKLIKDSIHHNKTDLLAALTDLQRRFHISLASDILQSYCCWECIIVWKHDIENTSMLSSAVLHLSSISNTRLKQGLAMMFWKAVFKEHVQGIFNLIEKIGKFPKDRLCRKHIGMSIAAVERYLLAAQIILDMLSELDAVDFTSIELQEEQIWRGKKREALSIIDSALDEAICNAGVALQLWCIVVTLRFVILHELKSSRPSELYDKMGSLRLLQFFPAAVEMKESITYSVRLSRQQFCLTVLSSVVEKEAKADNHRVDEMAMLASANDVLRLARYFCLEEDVLWKHFSCQLFLAGFDCAGTEAALSVHDKEMLVQPVISIVGSRLAFLLLETAEPDVLSKALSSLPTRITSWLQNQTPVSSTTDKITMDNNIKLLNLILGYVNKNSDSRSFITELLDGLELFKKL